MAMQRSVILLLVVPLSGCTAMRDVPITAGPDEPPPPPAVTRFSDLHTRLRPLADRVEVRAGDRKLKGTLVELSAESLVVRVKKGLVVRFACEDIDQVKKMGDSVEEGATAGSLLVAFPAWSGCQVGSTLRRTLLCVATGMTVFGGLGAFIDMLSGGPTVVYVRRPQSCIPVGNAEMQNYSHPDKLDR